MFIVSIGYLMSGVILNAQTQLNLPDFETLEEIEDYMPTIAITRYRPHINEETYAVFEKDPAMYLFEGDELDKALYRKSDKYIEDSKILNSRKKNPSCLVVKLEGSEYSHDIKDFTENGYTIHLHDMSVWNYTGHWITHNIGQNYVLFGKILFPMKRPGKKYYENPNYSWYSHNINVKCSDIYDVIDMRSNVNKIIDDFKTKEKSNDEYSIAIIYLPGPKQKFPINGKDSYEEVYFARVLKAYLIYNDEIIEDLTSHFATSSSTNPTKTTSSRKTTSKKKRK